MNPPLTRPELDFYSEALRILSGSPVPFLVGGAFALAHHGGVRRDTKDLDIFVCRADCQKVLDLFARQGYLTEVKFTHWLAKVHSSDHLVDVIFSSGNGIAEVDDLWFQHAEEAELLGRRVRLVPPEEMIWSKGFIMERDRFDGADILHVLRKRGRTLDWKRLLERFGPHWRVLLSHLIVFGFVYPGEASQVPSWVMADLVGRLEGDLASPPAAGRLCRGTLLSLLQYRPDVEEWGYRDARLDPESKMSAEEIRQWTQAFIQP